MGFDGAQFNIAEISSKLLLVGGATRWLGLDPEADFQNHSSLYTLSGKGHRNRTRWTIFSFLGSSLAGRRCIALNHRKRWLTAFRYVFPKMAHAR